MKAVVERIYMISMGSIVTGGMLLQSHLLSTTTMNRLLLGICCMTKDLRPKHWQMLKYQDRDSRMNIHSFRRSTIVWVPDAALTVDVACCFFDGAFRDEGGILRIARYHQGFTSSSLSWMDKRTDRTWQNIDGNSQKQQIAEEWLWINTRWIRIIHTYTESSVSHVRIYQNTNIV